MDVGKVSMNKNPWVDFMGSMVAGVKRHDSCHAI